MGFGARGKKRHRLGDGGPSEFKRAFAGQGSRDDASGSVTSKEPATQFLNSHFANEVCSWRNDSTSILNSDASPISTIVECHNADALSICSSRDETSRLVCADASALWGQPSVDTQCAKSDDTRDAASSFSDLRIDVTVSGHTAFATSQDSHVICEHKSSVGFAISNVRPIRMRGSRPLDYRQILAGRKDREGWVSYSCGGDLFKEGAFRRNYAGDASSGMQEFDEPEAEKHLRSAVSAISLENALQEYSAGVCMHEQHRTSISVGEDKMTDTGVNPNCKWEYSEDGSNFSSGMNESLLDCPTGPSINEDAFSGESKDKAQCTSYVHSSGRLSLEEKARLGKRSPTIEHDFEDYFSALLL